MGKNNIFFTVFSFSNLYPVQPNEYFNGRYLYIIITTFHSIVTFREKELIKYIFSGVSAQLEILIH